MIPRLLVMKVKPYSFRPFFLKPLATDLYPKVLSASRDFPRELTKHFIVRNVLNVPLCQRVPTSVCAPFPFWEAGAPFYR